MKKLSKSLILALLFSLTLPSITNNVLADEGELSEEGPGPVLEKKYVWCQTKQMYKDCKTTGNGLKCTTGVTCQ